MVNKKAINFLLRFKQSLCSRIRLSVYKLLGLNAGKNVRLHKINIPKNPWKISIGDNTYIDDQTVLLATGKKSDNFKIKIGSRCGFNRFTMIDAAERVKIEDEVRVGPLCYITDHDHGNQIGQPVHAQSLVCEPVHIGKDVWVGAGTTILKGVEIGDKSVVGAGAVVTESIPAASIVAGVPARVIGKRK